MLTELHALPEGFLEASAGGLHQVLPGPTLIHLPGRRGPALFVSVLLHGNEDTGLRAMQSVLARYAPGTLPRALSLFVGNVAAAALGQALARAFQQLGVADDRRQRGAQFV